MSTYKDSYDLDDLGCSFLKDLLPLIETYTYHGESQFLDIIDSETILFETSNTTSELLLFHASEETIQTIFNFNSENDISISTFISSFDISERLLLAKMPSTPHSVAADETNSAIRERLIPMGLFNSLQGYAGATIRGSEGRRGKQADYAWGPKRRAPGQANSPSVTLEIAYSESDAKLNSDVRFWLSPEDGNANICLTLRINRARPEIRLEKWLRESQGRIHRSQIVWITRKAGRPNVTGDQPLIIPFESLFRRQPDRPGETEIQLSAAQLEEIAATIWQQQGL